MCSEYEKDHRKVAPIAYFPIFSSMSPGKNIFTCLGMIFFQVDVVYASHHIDRSSRTMNLLFENPSASWETQRRVVS